MGKGIVVVFAAFALLASCATAMRSYDTTGFRDTSMNASNIAVGEGGLSADRIASILATRFPPKEPVSVSIFYMAGRPYDSDYDPMLAIVAKLRNLSFVERIVIVPNILFSRAMSIDVIQQIGIRSLSEYSIVFFGDARNIFFTHKSPLGTYVVSSTLEFMVIDNRTTAIIATDKLFSEFDTTFELFSDKAYRESLEKTYDIQSQTLQAKLKELFDGTGSHPGG
jgi:hypothetical protein